MHGDFLEFERPIAEIEAKINELRHATDNVDLNIAEEIARLKEKSQKLAQNIFADLTPHQTLQVARHPERPYTLNYIQHIFTDFDELHGDRHFADDKSIIGGTAKIGDVPVVVIGHQKGREVDEKVLRNFGMPKPEGYRKALRLMKLAGKFTLPIITLIDTPGAYPGIDAEERNQSEAIAKNLLVMSRLATPIISVVIGEGGSGGALAVGVSDRILMLQYSVYSVISPEGCASILWKTADKAKDAAEAMGITAPKLQQHQLIDKIIPEPLGGAHRDHVATASALKQALQEELNDLKQVDTTQLLEQRYDKLMLRQIATPE